MISSRKVFKICCLAAVVGLFAVGMISKNVYASSDETTAESKEMPEFDENFNPEDMPAPPDFDFEEGSGGPGGFGGPGNFGEDGESVSGNGMRGGGRGFGGDFGEMQGGPGMEGAQEGSEAAASEAASNVTAADYIYTAIAAVVLVAGIIFAARFKRRRY